MGPKTKTSRAELLVKLGTWLRQVDAEPLDVLLEAAGRDPTELNIILCSFVRHLWRSGAPYGRASETVNAVAAAKPSLKRLLQSVWDLLRQWEDAEPG